MKFASISHLMDESTKNVIPPSFYHDDLIVSPRIEVMGNEGYIIALNKTAKEIMNQPEDSIHELILKACLYAQNTLSIELIQLGALTTSVTKGGIWLTQQKDYAGYVNHGDSYTAAVTCQAVYKSFELTDKILEESTLAIIGAYGIIGEAVSKLLTPLFKKTYLIGRRKDKLDELSKKVRGSYELSCEIDTQQADIIVTATSHPDALLQHYHLKKNVIVVDVSQPPNLSFEVCKKRPDVIRIDGGYVDFPIESPIPIPGMPVGKNFACFAEVIMQSLENERENHVGSIDLNHLRKTEDWGRNYGFSLNELTNFGKPIELE